MSSSELLGNEKLFKEFLDLITTNINFREKMEDVGMNTHCMYHRRSTASHAIQTLVGNMKAQLKREGKKHVVSSSVDYQKYSVGRSGFEEIDKERDNNLVMKMNRTKKEPQELVFFEGAVFDATRNDKHISNAQKLLMLEVPSQDDVDKKRAIKLYASNDCSRIPDCVYYETPPSREEVLNTWGWHEVWVEPVPEPRDADGLIELYRKQYPLVHPGASTVSVYRAGCLRISQGISNFWQSL